MHPSRDHHLPPDPDAYRHAPHPKGRIIVIAPTRAACETIELALGLQLDTLLEREHGAEIRALAASGKGFGIVAGTGTGKTLGIRPIAESILGEALRGGRGQPRARGHAGDADLECGDRDDRDRPALVPGRPDHRPRHRDRRRDPPDVGRARALPGAGEARRLPLHLAQRDGGPDILRALSRQRRGPAHLRVRSQAQGAGAGAPAEAGRVPRRALRPPHHQGAAGCGGVPPDPSRGRAAGRGAG